MFTEKRLSWSSFFNKVAGWRSPALSKKIPAQVSSGGFCKICKNKYFEEHLQMPACAEAHFFYNLTNNLKD